MLVGILDYNKEKDQWFLKQKTPVYTLGSDTVIFLDIKPIQVHFAIMKKPYTDYAGLAAVVKYYGTDMKWYIVAMEIDGTTEGIILDEPTK